MPWKSAFLFNDTTCLEGKITIATRFDHTISSVVVVGISHGFVVPPSLRGVSGCTHDLIRASSRGSLLVSYFDLYIHTGRQGVVSRNMVDVVHENRSSRGMECKW